MEERDKEELEETWNEVKEVKKILCVDSNDTALLVMIYNEMMNKDNPMRDLPN